MLLPDFNLIFEEVSFTAVRSRGPGGQNVNKVSSSALLKWPFLQSAHLTDSQKSYIKNNLQPIINKANELYIRSDEFRDLERNKNRCLEKLQANIKKALYKKKPRRKTKPSKSAKKKRMDNKSKKGETKKLRKKPDY